LIGSVSISRVAGFLASVRSRSHFERIIGEQ
jgi:hypothetical protein